MIGVAATAPRGTPRATLYAAVMVRKELMGIEVARRSLGERVEKVKEVQTVMTKHGRPTAAIVDIEWFRLACAALGEPTDI